MEFEKSTRKYFLYIYFSDLVQSRLDVAKELGADHTLKVYLTDSEDDLVKVIEETIGQLPDVTIDCSGFESTITLGLKVSFRENDICAFKNPKLEIKNPKSEIKNQKSKSKIKFETNLDKIGTF